MADPLRILIVDDSPLMRRMLHDMVADDPDITVVGEAGDGRTALKLVAELRPDLITLDVRMPVMDGVETTRQVMAYYPTPILVLTASLSSHEVDITFQMLGAGALDVMEKPLLKDAAAVEQTRRALIRKIKLLARVRVVTHLRGRRKNPDPEPQETNPTVQTAKASLESSTKPAPPARSESPFPLVVIGASTGGPGVVRQILAGLPAGFAGAVLVVQHIAAGFSSGMSEWLGLTSDMPVTLATEGMALRPGCVLVAPDRCDIMITEDHLVHLSHSPLLLQRPSIDIAMQSAAEVFGRRTLGVLLTGMGRDGAIGMQSIRKRGGFTIAQNEATCAIYGMPRAAIELNAVDQILPPEQIITLLIERVGRRSSSRQVVQHV
ncbi:MAG: chemotaxis-specific protein-glutamate methyltransferase CheB [Oscillochloris sp.]|nr:chemotaxis-specific protein-glutamate methyltransferase CheB [Oscillochloris sp.]